MKTNNPYDGVEQIRSLMRTMDAEREMNYIGYLSNEIDDKTLLLDLRIHVEQLRQCVTQLQSDSRSHDRSLKWLAIGVIAVLIKIAKLFFRYEVKRALTIGWWHSLPVDTVGIAVIAFLLIVICGWLAVR